MQIIYIYISKYKVLQRSILITVVKTCEKCLWLSMTARPEVKVDNFHLYLKSHITKHLLTLISVDIRLSEYHFLGRCILMSIEIEVNNCIISDTLVTDT